MDLGDSEQRIAVQAIRSGNPLPDRIANKTELMLGLELFLTAYFELSTDRNYSFNGVPNPIPVSKMQDYCLFYRLDSEQTEDLIFLVRSMDIKNIERIVERMPKP